MDVKQFNHLLDYLFILLIVTTVKVNCDIFTSSNSNEIQPTLVRCSHDSQIDNCLKREIVKLLYAVANLRQEKIPIVGDSIVWVKNHDYMQFSSRDSRSSRSLNEQIFEAILNVFRSRTISIRLADWFPTDDLVEEGRGKEKKYKKYIAHILFGKFILKASLLPIMVGKVSLVAFKALLVSMMALLLGLSINFKKTSHGRKHSSPSVEVINLDPHHDYHDRSIKVGEGDQTLAYRGNLPIDLLHTNYSTRRSL